jgi:addiction module HigA family antidote
MTVSRPATGWNLQRVATHPGAILREDFLPALSLTAVQLSSRTKLPVHRVREILRERRPVTADAALRFARLFNSSPEFWLNLQTAHDLSKARLELKSRLESEIEPLTPEALTA